MSRKKDSAHCDDKTARKKITRPLYFTEMAVDCKWIVYNKRFIMNDIHDGGMYAASD
jgi:hypothetical protein